MRARHLRATAISFHHRKLILTWATCDSTILVLRVMCARAGFDLCKFVVDTLRIPHVFSIYAPSLSFERCCAPNCSAAAGHDRNRCSSGSASKGEPHSRDSERTHQVVPCSATSGRRSWNRRFAERSGRCRCATPTTPQSENKENEARPEAHHTYTVQLRDGFQDRLREI